MSDYVIFLGEEVGKKYPDKTWEECMEIVSDPFIFELHMGPLSKYHKMYIDQRRR